MDGLNLLEQTDCPHVRQWCLRTPTTLIIFLSSCLLIQLPCDPTLFWDSRKMANHRFHICPNRAKLVPSLAWRACPSKLNVRFHQPKRVAVIECPAPAWSILNCGHYIYIRMDNVNKDCNKLTSVHISYHAFPQCPKQWLANPRLLNREADSLNPILINLCITSVFFSLTTNRWSNLNYVKWRLNVQNKFTCMGTELADKLGLESALNQAQYKNITAAVANKHKWGIAVKFHGRARRSRTITP